MAVKHGYAKELLQRIADVLGIKVESFYDRTTDLTPTGEELILLKSFKRIVKQEDRQTCIEFVQRIAARQ